MQADAAFLPYLVLSSWGGHAGRGDGDEYVSDIDRLFEEVKLLRERLEHLEKQAEAWSSHVHKVFVSHSPTVDDPEEYETWGPQQP